MVDTIASFSLLAVFLVILVGIIWISSLASMQVYRALRRQATPAVRAGLLSACAWLGVFCFAWPVVGLYWAVRRLRRSSGR